MFFRLFLQSCNPVLDGEDDGGFLALGTTVQKKLWNRRKSHHAGTDTDTESHWNCKHGQQVSALLLCSHLFFLPKKWAAYCKVMMTWDFSISSAASNLAVCPNCLDESDAEAAGGSSRQGQGKIEQPADLLTCWPDMCDAFFAWPAPPDNLSGSCTSRAAGIILILESWLGWAYVPYLK